MPDGEESPKELSVLDVIQKRIAELHWFGEGTGGSGHMADISPGFINIESEEGCEVDGKPCTKVVYVYEVVRVSEFGGNTETFKKEMILDADKNIVSEEQLGYSNQDIMNPGSGVVEGDMGDDPFGLNAMIESMTKEDDDASSEVDPDKDDRNPAELLECARTWLGLTDDEGEVRKLLELAQAKTEDENDPYWAGEEGDTSRSWMLRNLADAWLTVLDDREHAEECLKKSEEKCLYAYELQELALRWLKIGEREKASKLMQDAQDAVDAPTEYLDLAKAWVDVFEDAKRAKEILAQAEKKMELSSELRSLARTWVELFKDRETAREAMKTAEKKALNFDDLIWTVLDWIGPIDDRDRGVLCMQLAESKAETSFNWSRCAKTWKKDFDDEEKALQCVKEAERLAQTVQELTDVARDWTTIFEDNEKALDCLRRAEGRAESFDDLHYIALEWLDCLEDTTATKRCLEEAEKKATKPWEWGGLAEVWARLGDDEGVKRCKEMSDSIEYIK